MNDKLSLTAQVKLCILEYVSGSFAPVSSNDIKLRVQSKYLIGRTEISKIQNVLLREGRIIKAVDPERPATAVFTSPDKPNDLPTITYPLSAILEPEPEPAPEPETPAALPTTEATDWTQDPALAHVGHACAEVLDVPVDTSIGVTKVLNPECRVKRIAVDGNDALEPLHVMNAIDSYCKDIKQMCLQLSAQPNHLTHFDNLLRSPGLYTALTKSREFAKLAGQLNHYESLTELCDLINLTFGAAE